jgi:hypothetical protein
MTLAALPSVAEVSRRDSLVDYASNLAGHEDAYLEGLGAADADASNVVSIIANAAMGALVIPSIMRRMRRGGPIPESTMLVGLVVGGVLGWWKPLPTTLVQSAALLLDV